MRKRRTKNSGCVYDRSPKADSRNYWIKYRGADGKWRYEGGFGVDRAKAEARLALITLGIEAPVAAAASAARFPALDDYAEVWLGRRMAPGLDGSPMIRSWKDDRARLYNHVVDFAGGRRLDELQSPRWVKEFIAAKRTELKPQSIRNCLNVISRLFNDWNEDHADDGLDLKNPVRRLDRATRKSIGRAWDPRRTPFLKTEEDIRAVFLALPELAEGAPWRAMFAVGVFAGLRTGEVRALRWSDVDLVRGVVHVQRSADGGKEGPLKDNDSRVALINETLRGVLRSWRTTAPAGDICFPSTGQRGQFVKDRSMYAELKLALKKAGLPLMKWYQATRHTFASHYVMNGGSLEMLAQRLGHSTTEVTLRYAHLQPDRVSAKERALVEVDLGGRIEEVSQVDRAPASEGQNADADHARAPRPVLH